MNFFVISTLRVDFFLASIRKFNMSFFDAFCCKLFTQESILSSFSHVMTRVIKTNLIVLYTINSSSTIEITLLNH